MGKLLASKSRFRGSNPLTPAISDEEKIKEVEDALDSYPECICGGKTGKYGKGRLLLVCPACDLRAGMV